MFPKYSVSGQTGLLSLCWAIPGTLVSSSWSQVLLCTVSSLVTQSQEPLVLCRVKIAAQTLIMHSFHSFLAVKTFEPFLVITLVMFKN